MNISTLHAEFPAVNDHLDALPCDCQELTLDTLSAVAGGFDGYNLY